MLQAISMLDVAEPRSFFRVIDLICFLLGLSG